MLSIISKLFVALTAGLSFLMPTSITKPQNEQLSDNIVIYFTTSANDGNIDISAKINSNSGITNMLLTLEYDESVVEFVGYDKGVALQNLDLMTTNTQTEQGYSIKPFNFNWFSENVTNDFSVGEFLKLHFVLRDDAPNGNYRITLSYVRDRDISYVDGDELKTKNAVIGEVRFEVKNNAITDFDDINADEDSSVLLIVGISAGLVIVIGASIFVAVSIKNKKKKKWVKV